MPLGIAIAAMSMRFTKLVKRPRLPFLAQDTVDAVFSSASISALPQRFCHRPLQGSSGDRQVIHYRHAATWWIDVLAKASFMREQAAPALPLCTGESGLVLIM